MTIEAWLIDLDGVVYVGGSPVPGAREAIRYLRDNGYPFRFVSNTTRKSRATLARQLAGMGFEIPASHIFTPASAAAGYLSLNRKRSAWFLTTEEVAEEIIAESGAVRDGGLPESVVIGDAGDRMTYGRLNEAFRYLRTGAELMALEKDRFWMGVDGMMLSAGPFVTALEFATGKEAIVMGKPSPAFFRMAIASLQADPSTTAMIGDDILTDVGGALACGLSGFLVKTGKYTDVALEQSAVRPTAILGSIADLPALIEAGIRS